MSEEYVSLRTPQVIQYITELYMVSKVKPSILLLGPPGIGKSVGVKTAAQQIAKMLNKQFVEYDDSKYEEIMKSPNDYFVFVDLRLTEVEPSDLLGIPRAVNGTMFYIPPSWASVLSKAPGILFLDEITQVQRDDIFAVAHKVLLDKMSGFTRFRDDVMVIAAGNTPKDSPIARALPSSLINRVIVIYASRPEIPEWAEYMNDTYGDEWEKSVLAYLMYQPNDFYEPLNPNELERLYNFATPRTWTMAAIRLYELLHNSHATAELIRATLTGLLGSTIGSKLYAFITSKVDVEEVLRNPGKFASLDLDKQYFVLASAADMYNVAAYRYGDADMNHDEGTMKEAIDRMQLIENFLDRAIIKPKINHWKEFMTVFFVLLSNKARGKYMPRRLFWDRVISKNRELVSFLGELANLKKQVVAQ